MTLVSYTEDRPDGLLDTIYFLDGVPVAKLEGYTSGEEADADFREWLETERQNR